MDFSKSVFSRKLEINPDVQVIFVSDFFVNELPNGGAELTTEAIIESSPYKIQKVKAKDVSINLLKNGHEKYWIFGNSTQMDPSLIPTVVANMKYSIIEYDFKYCRARSPEKHSQQTGQPCDCHEQVIGKTISAFFHGAQTIFWMSERQMERYFKLFPFLRKNNNHVISSIFDKESLSKIKLLRDNSMKLDRKGWVVLNSNSWIKGTDDAIKFCEKNNLSYDLISGLSYDQVLSKLASSEGLVYLPKGGDTCPRMVIEAKLLDCKIVMNENVLHHNEDWFKTNNVTEIESYLYGSPGLFWKIIKSNINHVPTLSGYTTVYNCESQKYPYKKVITNLLEFCNEVCVVDGGSTDGTWEELQKLSEKYSEIKIQQIPRDWKSENFSIYDGMQKAAAREMCTMDFCWQQDSDELVPRNDYKKIENILKSSPANISIVSLPVVEYWGSYDKVRIDVQPWKWRLSKNDPEITHGVPKDMIEIVDGKSRIKPGTDGCDMINKTTRERLGFMTFHTEESEKARQAACSGNEQAREQYEKWFNHAIETLPSIHHYSWVDIERKIKLYRDYWSSHWQDLWSQDKEDKAENNMFFDCPWSDVTDKMIEERAKELSENTGGHIFHSKWNGKKTPHISVSRIHRI